MPCRPTLDPRTPPTLIALACLLVLTVAACAGLPVIGGPASDGSPDEVPMSACDASVMAAAAIPSAEDTTRDLDVSLMACASVAAFT